MPTIDVLDVHDDKNIQFHLLPDDTACCLVAGVELYPTPAWLCRLLALKLAETARNQLFRRSVTGSSNTSPPDSLTQEQMCQEGFRLLREATPVNLNLSFEQLHAREEGPS